MRPIASSGLVEEANKLYRTKVQEGTGKENILQSHDNDNEMLHERSIRKGEEDKKEEDDDNKEGRQWCLKQESELLQLR